MQTYPPRFVYKILDRHALSTSLSSDSVPMMPIDISDGYCHLSTAEQLEETLSLHFKGQNDLSILAVRVPDIQANLKWEPSRGGQLFPHAYGEIPRSAIEWTEVVSVDRDGGCRLPDRLK